MVLKNENSLPWTEKYRPKNLDSITHQNKVVSVMKKIVGTKNLPHLLFYGPAGTGKTSTILALAKELYGSSFSKGKILELNASDERGINVIREKIKNFASLAVKQTPNCPSYKLIILDEADWMTTDAQNALRRVMEKFSDVTRFCIICNYVSKIIPPIASRCSKFHFIQLPNEAANKRLHDVCEKENIKISNEVISEITEITSGDLRKAIILLQSSFEIFGENVTVDNVRSVCIQPPKNIFEQIMNCCIENNSLKEIKKVAEKIIKEGYSTVEIVKGICLRVVKECFDPNLKAKICAKCSEVEFRLLENASAYLQLLDLMYFINSVLKEEN